jgi:phosphate transport system permease protein
MLKDKIAEKSMTIGGISVIMAVLLIFFYLFYVVLPLFIPASMEKMQQFNLPDISAGKTLHLAVEEKNEVAVRFTEKARAVFFSVKDGRVISDNPLPIPESVQITSFAVADPATAVVAFGLSDGRVLVVKPTYKIHYQAETHHIEPVLAYPLGESPVVLDEQGKALDKLAIQLNEKSNSFVAVTADNRLTLVNMIKTVNFLDGAVTFERTQGVLPLQQAKITHLLLEKEQRIVYLADQQGQIWYIDIAQPATPQLVQRVRVVEADQQITTVNFLTGDISLLIGDSQGRIAQWFLVRTENGNKVLQKIREFHQQTGHIIAIAAEERRKGFVALDQQNQVGIYHSTAHRTLLIETLAEGGRHVAIAPRADILLIEGVSNQLYVWHIHNEHPEVSWSALWHKVWYENHEKPKYMWQSSAASNDFEPKFSLTPLVFGTLKAAFYAMVFAVPIAIFGAIYTAYFMTPELRTFVKPTIEIMEALPTVILGFLAGLWLAPTIEANLAGIFLLLTLTPIGILLFAYLWRYIPKRFSYRLDNGWQAVLLIPVVLLVSGLAFALSQPVESLFFEGDLRQWLTAQGIDFDQRNALIVGLTMGLAVIPSIFSITEDAIFSVPKHLTTGSLALGATLWQTMTRVVILTASPGIFSAVMIGLGRAVGETMIVLMATGNTPIMDWNIFEGLRTLSANIAVEMPESEVNSTHFRLLFLSGLVLFLFTFFFNTLAEVVRQRLRRKYSSL